MPSLIPLEGAGADGVIAIDVRGVATHEAGALVWVDGQPETVLASRPEIQIPHLAT